MDAARALFSAFQAAQALRKSFRHNKQRCERVLSDVAWLDRVVRQPRGCR